jgi:hypothetical protein
MPTVVGERSPLHSLTGVTSILNECKHLISTVIKLSICSVSSRLPRHRQTGVVQAQSATGV